MNALDYLLKANLYGLLFAGCYYLLLRRHTFFTLNRVYLLASALLTLTLPLLELRPQVVEPLPVPVGVIMLPVIDAPVETGPDWEVIGWWAYALVAAALLALLAIRIVRLARFIARSARQRREGYVAVLPTDPATPTFSFFRYVVFNPADTQNPLVLRHELVHVRQWHSADVLTMAVLRSVCWLCPALWLLERALRQVHEFLADQEASRQRVETPSHYARFLVEYSFGLQPNALANGFLTPSLLKERIQMLHRRTTSRWQLGKYVLVLPLLLALLAMTTRPDEVAALVQQTRGNTVTVTGRVTAKDGSGLPGAHVVVVGTNKGTNTDAQGRYKIDVLTKGYLSFSFVGFRSEVVQVNGHTAISVTLAEATAADLPAMGNTAMYKAVKPNPKMPARVDPSVQVINGEKWYAVEEKAVFPTGVPGLMQHVAQHLRYPAAAKAKRVQGDVMVSFLVLNTGAVSGVKVVRGIGSGCDEEAARVVRLMPKWLPAKQNGKAISTRLTIPIRFVLDDNRTGEYVPTFRPTNTPIGDFPVTKVGIEPGTGTPSMSAIRSAANVNPMQSTRWLRLVNVKASKIPYEADTLPTSKPGMQPEHTIFLRSAESYTTQAQPLWILDGKEVAEKDRQKLDPNDIESITVLKDAAATAQYGEKGKNGVILITSKKRQP